ncbi:hypothetical protein SEVIR_5G231400v4 [Setaria viridis]|uniref:Zinc finger LSD1-type domain-containing protein n=1 Tax=Setaria viridis TaxID=4556 RepID=A0A4U6UH54_SETVI|nr:nascent polypeptide-associated complex subunit alpha, muscle-specific form-like [Setaria viridis]TKW15338.1 hypothetical protein SEVIR_5G231400v2 [Setaria viridis]TKW15339.1 hypothetical protein SEVIR_5G231400v2 [Setaria viridis]
MAASPETAEPPETSDTHSSPHPPSSPRLHPTQENPSLTTAAPPEMANPDQFTPVPPPPAEQSTVEHSEAEPLPPTPIDEAEPPPSHPPPPEAEPAASSAFEAIPTEKVASPSPLPKDVAVEVSHEVAASAPSPSPSPSPQIVGASPEDAPQPPSPPRTPPATTAHISTDPSTTGATAMASQDQEEAARPSLAPETMDADSRTAPAPLTLPMESGPEGLLSQQKPRPPSPTLCENLEPAQPSPQPCHPAESTDASLDAAVDEAVEGTLEKAAGSLPVPEVTNRDMDITTGMLPAWEIGSEEMLSQQQLRPPCLEIAPLRGENPKSVWPPQPPPPAESTYGWSNAATNEASAVASEEATVSLEFGAERSLQEPVQTSKTSILEAEPCSPEMAPPGFEDFKSQWLPLSSPTLAESTHNVVQVAAINPVGMTPDAATESLPASEAMDMEINISPGLLPPLKSRAEVRSLQPPLGSCSPMMEAAPCSPDMPPPGFENCKSSWLPQPTIPPLCETTYALPDVASTKAGTSVEKACSVLALEATDVETGTERWRLPQLQSGTGGSLQEPLPRSPSPTMQAAPCSLDTAPPGFENMKAMHVTSKGAPQSSSASALEAMDLDMDAAPAVAPSSESKAGKSLPPETPLVPSHVAQHTACSLRMAPSGSENVESAQQLLPPAAVLPPDETPDALADAGTKTVTMEQMRHPVSVTGATEEANGSILPAALENGCDDPLPNLEPQASPAAVHAAPTSPEIAPTSFENSESFQQTSPCLAETIDPSAHSSATMPAIVKSNKTNLPLSPLQATDADMESATRQQSPLKSEERSLPQPEQHPSSPSVKNTNCSPEVAPPGYENLDSSEQLPLPPPLSMKFEMGQMVCGCCRQLLAYPKGAVHVQCFGCWTINLVLEEHQVGKVYCGECDTLLMYPFGAPAVKCSNCLFVTEIGERNVRPRISTEQSVSPHPQEVVHQS